MKWRDYQDLLPGGASLLRLAAWVRLYVGDELGWEAKLVLHAQEVPGVCLGQQGFLGWSCWLQTQRPQKDPDELVLAPLVA
jgi:type VI secretion system protein ImpH